MLAECNLEVYNIVYLIEPLFTVYVEGRLLLEEFLFLERIKEVDNKSAIYVLYVVSK